MTDTGVEVIKSSLTPVLPTEIYGFSVRVGVGPYPPDSPRSHRKAVYAELTPLSQRARDLVRSKGSSRILGLIPLTPEAAAQISADPDGQLAEMVGKRALAEASRLARPAKQ